MRVGWKPQPREARGPPSFSPSDWRGQGIKNKATRRIVCPAENSQRVVAGRSGATPGGTFRLRCRGQEVVWGGKGTEVCMEPRGPPWPGHHGHAGQTGTEVGQLGVRGETRRETQTFSENPVCGLGVPTSPLAKSLQGDPGESQQGLDPSPHGRPGLQGGDRGVGVSSWALPRPHRT